MTILSLPEWAVVEVADEVAPVLVVVVPAVLLVELPVDEVPLTPLHSLRAVTMPGLGLLSAFRQEIHFHNQSSERKEHTEGA
jgi:hypothetical protein